ncbi:MAG: esterase [SAR86 cluster bacterium]|uniref:Esterase n=1 Tax=SAR86 cluster bacterium TaxID=2030880 RepID=A0A2A4WTD0_9GAMM|nr:MAG: esterase [SAR86 cluster bacterium]
MFRLLSAATFVFVLLSAPVALAAEAELSNVSFPEVLAVPYREADLTHSYGENQFQFGQLWLPTASPARASLVLIHGGCWQNQFDITYSHGLSSALADAGFAVWSLEYRRTGDEGGAWPGTFEDIIAGINSLDEIDGIESENLAILGHSAGGHLALLAGARSELLTVEPDLIVGLAAISDVVSYAAGSNTCQAATPDFMGGDVIERAQEYFDANPGNHGLHENTVLLAGDIDEIVPLSQATLPGARTIISTGANHFDWAHPNTLAYRRLLELLDEYF